jgi:hypothetical protein
MNLREFISNLESNCLRTGSLKISLKEAWGKGVCASCLKPALENCYSDAGQKEYYISGLCERCFDQTTKEEE